MASISAGLVGIQNEIIHRNTGTDTRISQQVKISIIIPMGAALQAGRALLSGWASDAQGEAL